MKVKLPRYHSYSDKNPHSATSNNVLPCNVGNTSALTAVSARLLRGDTLQRKINTASHRWQLSENNLFVLLLINAFTMILTILMIPHKK